eukprot:m.32538 g.32538  ORF g.32538 m.32538 type:complete len:324 (-) comp14996_c0_seq2:19-990(-)
MRYKTRLKAYENVDDVGAVCIANALMDRGEVDILAIVHNTGYPEGIGAVSAMNHYYGRDDIPLGAYKGIFGHAPNNGPWVTGKYVPDIVANFSGPVTNYTQVPEAVSTYRNVLSKAEDHSVVIASIGFAVNIAALLESGPDEFSPLNGSELVALKIRQVTWMGGWYPPVHPNNHTTFNLACGRTAYNHTGCEGASKLAVERMPKNVTQVFSDIGDTVLSGGVLTTCSKEPNPCRQAYIDRQGPSTPRSSWDPTVTLLSIRGPDGVDGHLVGGLNVLSEDGANFWTNCSGTNQAYLVLNEEQSRSNIAHTIDTLLCQPPKKVRR